MNYRTIEAPASAEFTEKHSRFIGYVAPARDEKEALTLIAAVKKKRWDATHNVYAYVLYENGAGRFSDDGEPQGTAGMPALTVLRQQKIFDAAAVVTRYFGGTLLGAGGLVRAYANAVKLALANAKVIEKKRCGLYSLSCGYAFYEPVKSLVLSLGGALLNTVFLQSVRLEAAVPSEKAEVFAQKVGEITSGGESPEFEKEIYL